MRNFRHRLRTEFRDALTALAEGLVFFLFLGAMALAIGVFFHV